MKKALVGLVAAASLAGCSGTTGNVPGNGAGWATISVTVVRAGGALAGAGVPVTEEEVGGPMSVQETNATSAVNFFVASNSAEKWCFTEGNDVTPNPALASTACVVGPLLPEAQTNVQIP